VTVLTGMIYYLFLRKRVIFVLFQYPNLGGSSIVLYTEAQQQEAFDKY
jgi:hypothetical protein